MIFFTVSSDSGVIGWKLLLKGKKTEEIFQKSFMSYLSRAIYIKASKFRDPFPCNTTTPHHLKKKEGKKEREKKRKQESQANGRCYIIQATNCVRRKRGTNVTLVIATVISIAKASAFVCIRCWLGNLFSFLLSQHATDANSSALGLWLHRSSRKRAWNDTLLKCVPLIPFTWASL